MKEKRNILHTRTIEKRKASCLGHILLRNSLLKHLIEKKIERGIEVQGRQGRRRTQLLHDLKETRGYWKFKQEARDFGRG
jgi:hypothetical protein